ncbi:MAG: trypsin-like peptidase domain-containing protein [Phycisphaerales bacterium]
MLKNIRPMALAAAIGVACATFASAFAQETFGTAGPPAGEWPIAQELPLTKTYGAGVQGVVPTIKLDALDNAQLAADALIAQAQAPGKPRRIGVARAITLDAGMGAWAAAADGGSVWVLDVTSSGAVGMRIHFTQIALPAGAKLVAYNPVDPNEIGGPYTGQGGVESDDVYTPVTTGDRVRIEFYLPPGVQQGALPFDADNIQHLFHSPMKDLTGGGEQPRGGGPDITPTVGNCHNDVTCYPAWANTAKAVGMFVFSDSGGTAQCTGQLIDTTSHDLTPYFLTAAHCVNTAAEASSVQVYWLFQTATCNGAAPNQGSSPTTTGATLIATRPQSDGTLLRLTGALPGNLFWAGWTSTAVTNGTACAGIHHPDGSWKRISFGNATDQAGCTLGTQAETIDSTWTSGVTEGGSSGSGFFRTDTQQLIGTLSCGPSFCGATGANLHDGYGRFASFYPSIASFLAGGGDDTLEENDTCAAARALSPVLNTTLNNTGLIVKLTDEDWYTYTLPAGATLNVTLTFTAANGTVNGQLFTTCGGAVIASTTGTGGTRTLTYVNSSGSADQVYLRVYLTGTNPSNTYDMATLAAQIPSNDACANAITVTSGNSYAGTTVNATNDGTSTCPAASAARTRPDIWYKFTALAAGTLTLDTCQTTPTYTDTVLSLHSACPGNAANQVACNDDATTTGPCSAGGSANLSSYISYTMAANQTVYIRVAMWARRPARSPCGSTTPTRRRSTTPAAARSPSGAGRPRSTPPPRPRRRLPTRCAPSSGTTAWPRTCGTGTSPGARATWSSTPAAPRLTPSWRSMKGARRATTWL